MSSVLAARSSRCFSRNSCMSKVKSVNGIRADCKEAVWFGFRPGEAERRATEVNSKATLMFSVVVSEEVHENIPSRTYLMRLMNVELEKQDSSLAICSFFACFGGAYALIPYFVLWRPLAPRR